MRDTEHEMKDEAGRMQHRLDELEKHVEDAKKKAEHTRAHTDLPGDEPVDAAAGDASQRSTSSDDPAGAVGNPAEADEDKPGR